MSVVAKNVPVWVTGTGTVTCAGISPQELWQSALEDRSGIEDGLGRVSQNLLEQMRERIHHSPYRSFFNFLFSKLPDSKAVLMAFYALTEAIQNAGGVRSPDDGIILATTTGQIPVWDRALLSYLKKEISENEFKSAFQHQPLGSLLDALTEPLGFHRNTLLLTSACTAATQAIAIACLWIKQGRVKRCFVGGVEILCDLTIQGFKSLQLLSCQLATPFDVHRTGINLSEGAGFLCLEASSGTDPLAKILGFGLSTDAYHMTAPHPEGRGSLEAMQKALEMADLNPAEISWVHAHGTGSHHNDLAEAKAIGHLFQKRMPWVSSTKRIHGHALGASGAIESILCIQALQKQMILRTAGLTNPDPQIQLAHPPHALQAQQLQGELNHILKNTLGFGGINASLVISGAKRSIGT